ncbi:MAG: cation:proton antiporter, partial [Clostridia bacterium]|nr:cation:proton antiporter [Clostridia bacterium]
SIALVLAGVGLCDILNLSSLLVCMMIGAMMVNLSQQREVLMEQCDHFTPPLFLLFFVLSGADLDLSVLPSVGVIGLLYLVLRSIGKWGGTWLGAVCVKADKNIRHYLGLTLLPQAGVAIGMAALVSARFPTLGPQVNTIVLAGVLVFELVGPVITKIALTKAGEIPAAK